MRHWFILLALILAAPLAAQQPEWVGGREFDVLLEPYAFEPDPIRLTAGEPVKLRFMNRSEATLSLSASDFFRASTIRTGDEAGLADGHLRLAPGEERVVALVPTAGRYRMRSGNLFHRLLGMSTLIIVESP